MSIINALPGIVPTARTYSMGQWPQKRMKMRNARTVRWPLCSKPSGDKMDLVWENITYAQAEQLCAVWDSNYGIYGQLTLPAATLTGTSGALNSFLATPYAGVTWHFVGNPQVESVKAGRCTVRMPIGTRMVDVGASGISGAKAWQLTLEIQTGYNNTAGDPYNNQLYNTTVSTSTIYTFPTSNVSGMCQFVGTPTFEGGTISITGANSFVYNKNQYVGGGYDYYKTHVLGYVDPIGGFVEMQRFRIPGNFYHPNDPNYN